MKTSKIMIAATIAASALASCNQSDNNSIMYLSVGSYAPADSSGIAIYAFNCTDGSATRLSDTRGIANPSYQAVCADKNWLCSVSETGDDKAALVAYRFNRDNAALEEINRLTVDGADPCYVWVDSKRRLAVTANYSGGSITAIGINPDGSLANKRVISFTGSSVDTVRQAKPHLHCTYASPDERFLFANDLGTDSIHGFGIIDTGNSLALETLADPSIMLTGGEGPRHTEFHPNGRFAYVIGELSGNVTTMQYANGKFTVVQSIEADSLHASGSADIHISPDGRFLYASNRLKGDGIAIFAINATDGTLTKVGYQPTGIHPRNFIITPDGRFLLCACRDSNVIQVFSINPASGLLVDTHRDIAFSKPVCLKLFR